MNFLGPVLDLDTHLDIALGNPFYKLKLSNYDKIYLRVTLRNPTHNKLWNNFAVTYQNHFMYKRRKKVNWILVYSKIREQII